MNNLNLLIPTSKPGPTDKWLWATVTQADPLLIRLDGDEDPLPAPPEDLCGNLSVGDRVWVQLSGVRVIVHAPSGGVPVPEAPEQVDMTPTGTMHMWVDSTAPTGYLMCDGSTFSSDDHPALAALLGDKFGAHSGTTYYLPDMRQRFPLGNADPAGTPVGSTGGTDKLTLTMLPQHTHSINHDHPSFDSGNTSHNHSLAFRTLATTNTSGGSALRVTDIDNQNGGSGSASTATTGNNSHSHTVNVPAYEGDSGPAGQATPDSFLPPYMALNFIIKAD